MTRGPSSSAACLLSGLLVGCSTPPKEPSLLDRELAAYRVDREDRRVEDLSERLSKAKAEGERLEAALAQVHAENAARRRALEDAERQRSARPASEGKPPLPPPARAGGPR